MGAGFNPAEAGGAGQGLQFLQVETGFHRSFAIVQSHGIPAKHRPGDAQEMVRERMALEVDDQYVTPSDGAKLTKEFDDLLILEVVEEQRAQNKVERFRNNGKPERIGYEPRRRSAVQMERYTIEAKGLRAGKGIRQTAGQITRGGADIEQ